MLAIMIPTYNERENITYLVQDILDKCKNLDVRIVIVDDNSPDGTGHLADKLKKKYPSIHVLHRKTRGRGTAGIDGFRYCLNLGADYIVEMDADFSHDPKYLPLFIEKIKKYDIVIGSRFISGGEMPNRSFFRNVLTDIINLYLKVIFGTGIHDMSGGFKCYRRRVLESVNLKNLVSKKYSIGAEILYLASKKGFTFKEIPVSFKDRDQGVSKCDLSVMSDYILSVLKIKLKHFR